MSSIRDKILGVLKTFVKFPPIAVVVLFARKYKIIPKLVCLLLSVLFWFYVDSKRLAESHFKIPVRVDISREYAVSDLEKKYISVIARGSSDDLRNVTQSNISTFVKIQNPDLTGAARYPVSVIGNDIPETVTFFPEDKTLFVKVERRVSKRIRIIPLIEDDPDSEYVAGNPRITPEEIEISGAESIVKKIDDISTEPISLAGKRSSFDEQYRLSDGDMKQCELSQKFIDIHFPVYSAKDITRVYSDMTLRNTVENVSYTVPRQKIQILVRNDKTDTGLSPDDFDVWIDFNEGRPANLKDDTEVILGLFTVHARSKGMKQIETVVPDRILVKARKK